MSFDKVGVLSGKQETCQAGQARPIKVAVATPVFLPTAYCLLLTFTPSLKSLKSLNPNKSQLSVLSSPLTPSQKKGAALSDNPFPL